MNKLTTFGKEVEEEMKASFGIFNQGMEELKELSSNDLTALISTKDPDSDIVAVMDAVLVLQGKEKGWENLISCMTSKDFMYNITQFRSEDSEPEQLALAAECRKLFEPATVKPKSKAAGAFAFWVDGICCLRKVHDEKLPVL